MTQIGHRYRDEKWLPIHESPMDLVRVFHERFGCEIDERDPEPEVLHGRVDLLEEEFVELRDELIFGNRIGAAKELADLVYVAYGTAIALGIDLDLAVAEVHRSNMSKMAPDGTFQRREDGKILKGDHYSPADVSAAVSER